MRSHRIASLAATVIAATSLALVPQAALAFDAPTSDSWLEITPCEVTCLSIATFDPSDTLLQDITQIDPVGGFLTGADFVEFDNESGTGFFWTAGVLDAINVETETGFTELATTSDISANDINIRGLGYDDLSDELYLLWWDGTDAHYFVATVDTTTGDISPRQQISDDLMGWDAGEIAVYDGTMYVSTANGDIVFVDLSDGSVGGSVAYPLELMPRTLDVDSDGNLRFLGVEYTGDGTVISTIYNVTDAVWTDTFDTDDTGNTYWAWWDTDVAVNDEPPAPQSLPNTGFTAVPLAISAAGLVLAGAVAVRRRARR